MSFFNAFWGGVNIVSLLVSLAFGNVAGAVVSVVCLFCTVV
ncbi:hypothetical protein [Bartonella sp. CB175]